MGKGSSAPAVPAATVQPTAGENYASSIKAYLENLPQLQQAESADIQKQLANIDQYTPQALALNAKYSPQYNQQIIDLEKQMAPQYDQLQRDQFTRTANQVKDLTPLLRSTEDPQNAAIRTELGRQIESELGMGASLDPSLQREIEQAVRSGQSSRGMMRGNSAVSAEALVKGTQADQLRRNRQSAASQFLQLQAQTQQDPWTMITGVSSTRQSTPYQATQPTNNATSTVGGLTNMQSGINASNSQSQNQVNLLQSQLNYNTKAAKDAGAFSFGKIFLPGTGITSF